MNRELRIDRSDVFELFKVPDIGGHVKKGRLGMFNGCHMRGYQSRLGINGQYSQEDEVLFVERCGHKIVLSCYLV